MRAPAFLCSAILVTIGAAATPLAAQTVGPPAPRITPPEQKCEEAPADDDEIVVCGENPENSPFRVPKEFRGLRSDDDRDASFAARQRDMNELERFSSQTSGPSGWLQNAQQRDCAWRAERQQLRGERPDCSRQVNSIGPIGRK